MLDDSVVDELVADARALIPPMVAFVAKWTPRQDEMLSTASKEQISRLAVVSVELQLALDSLNAR
jgi:hypothetical protein